MNEIVVWFSSVILVLTISAQLRKQWRSGTSKGISKWLFIGQVCASLGFVWYSVLVHNWVFVVTNALLGLEACAGLALLFHHRRRERRAGPSATRPSMCVIQSP